MTDSKSRKGPALRRGRICSQSERSLVGGVGCIGGLRKHSKVRWRFRVQARYCFRVIGFRAGTRRRSRLFGDELLDETKIPYFRIYDLRSTYTTILNT